MNLVADSANKNNLKDREASEERLKSILADEAQNQNVLN